MELLFRIIVVLEVIFDCSFVLFFVLPVAELVFSFSAPLVEVPVNGSFGLTWVCNRPGQSFVHIVAVEKLAEGSSSGESLVAKYSVLSTTLPTNPALYSSVVRFFLFHSLSICLFFVPNQFFFLQRSDILLMDACCHRRPVI